MQAIGEGTLPVELDGEDGTVPALLADVLHVPSLASNLLSVRCLTKKGLRVSFDKDKCEIERDGVVIATAPVVNDMYKLHLNANPLVAAAAREETSIRMCVDRCRS